MCRLGRKSDVVYCSQRVTGTAATLPSTTQPTNLVGDGFELYLLSLQGKPPETGQLREVNAHVSYLLDWTLHNRFATPPTYFDSAANTQHV